jgi:biopolymer transport protein ExbD
MRFRKKKKYKNSSAFDVTPLVDVMFLIQIFFLLTLGSPLKITEVSLPESNIGETLAKEAITVAISSTGIRGNGKNSTETALKALAVDKDIIILASRDIPYFRVISLLDLLKSSGHERISLATKPLKS